MKWIQKFTFMQWMLTLIFVFSCISTVSMVLGASVWGCLLNLQPLFGHFLAENENGDLIPSYFESCDLQERDEYIS